MTEINFLLKVYLNDVSKPAVRLIREKEPFEKSEVRPSHCQVATSFLELNSPPLKKRQ